MVVSLVIRGSPENKNGLALGKGFKTTGSDTRIIHDTNVNILSGNSVIKCINLRFSGF
jgi:hypothetical protein